VSEANPPEGGTLPTAADARIDAVCDRFEDVWRQGGRPRLEDFLAGAPGPERPGLLRELLRLDLHYRTRAGECPGPEEYRRRLPDGADVVDAVFAAAPAAPGADSPAARAPSGDTSGGAGTGPQVPSPGAAAPPAGPAPPAPPVLPARAGRYVIEGEIARGGMGAVLRARDPDLHRPLAVKVLLAQHGGRGDLERRFLEEAQVTGQLQHPGVPPVHEVGRLEDGRPFFAMKLIKGRTLAELLKERRQPAEDLPRFLAVFEQVCQAVAYAHSKGVIHRDLKPANVMVGAFGEVQVMDWGLAKVLGGGPPAEAPEAEASAIATVRTGAEGLSSQAGAVLGTPAYMAPEQARGEVERLDARCDVFGLGAILCVLLTGAPPYRGGGPEAWRRAQQGDLTDAFARLEASGADAELVGLARACLAAEPEDRPRDAGAVAQAVAAYQAGVQRRLRQAELEAARATARAQAERRARWLLAGLAAALLVLGLAAGGGGLWWAWQRAERDRQRDELERAVQADLEEAAGRLGAWQPAEAHVALVRAEGRVAGGGPDDLARRVGQMRQDLDLADALDQVRLKAATWVGGRLDYASVDRGYAALLGGRGLAVPGEEPQAVAARLRGSAARPQLVAALDDWATAAGDGGRRSWLLEVARRADPGGWGDRFRDPAARADRAALERLAREADVAELSPQALTALGVALWRAGADAVPLLTAAQARYPADFWLNYNLGQDLYTAKRWEEAVGYFRVALALRPGTSAAHNALGVALQAQGRLDDALREYHQAIALDPKLAPAHTNLGYALYAQGRLDDAIQECRRAIELDPKYAWAHNNLGVALQAQGRLDDAIPEFRRGIELDPKLAAPHNNLGLALYQQGRLDDAIREYSRAIALDPKDAKAPYNLGNALYQQGRLDDAIREYSRAIELDPKDAWAHEGLGVALAAQGRLDDAIRENHKAIALDPKNAAAHTGLGLALAAQGRLDDAIRAYRTAIDLDPKQALAHYNLGNALKAQGRLDDAIREYRQAIALKPDFAPAHCNLGHALLARGQFRAALQSLRRGHELGTKDPRWPYPSADWVRQCQRLADLDDRLPALLRGADRPQDAQERLALADLCQQRSKRRYAAAARFYAAAFAEQPKLAEDPRGGHRYNAACAAALAAAGQGQDADPLDDQEKARLRRQALDWLRADLTAWAKVVEKDSPQDRALVQRTLQHWQKDPDLAGLRDQDALAKLPEPERDSCRKLWADVDALLRRAQGPK
jgi:serine/threonine-protein kinase